MEETMLKDNLSDFFIQKKIEIMMDINNRKVNDELKRISDMVFKLNSEISDLKRQLNGVKVTQKTEPTPVSNNIRENFRNESSEAKSEQTPRPRYGDYTPEDVNINKMFYFGNRK